jgi:hypothetical protein
METTLKEMVYGEEAWGRSPESREVAAHRKRTRLRRELEDPGTLVTDLPPLVTDLAKLGDETDLARLILLLSRRSDLDKDLVEMTGENIRALRERVSLGDERMRAELEREERMLLRLMAPSPRRTDSVQAAVRRGKVVAEGGETSSLKVEIVLRRKARPGYYATIVTVSELKRLGLEGLSGVEEPELWGCARDRTLPTPARLRALDELVERDDPGVPAFAVDELERAHADRRWRDELLLVTERVVVHDPWLRVRLTRSLLTHAGELLGGRDRAPLWAALRRYATLVRAEEAGSLVAFLDAPDALTHQVVFQSIANVFSVVPPGDAAPLDALRARIAELAPGYLRQSPPLTGEEMSLAMTAFLAAAALGSADLERLDRLLLGEHERWIVDTAAERLRALLEAWQQAEGGDRTRAFHAVEASLRRLSAPSA